MPGQASAAYEAAGVNLEAGDDASKVFKAHAEATYANREGEFGYPQELSGGFRGVRIVDLEPVVDLAIDNPQVHLGRYTCADGVGRKPRVAERMGKFDTLGEDLVAMVADDASASGAEPIGLTNILVVNTLGKKSDHPNKVQRIFTNVEGLAVGLATGAGKARMVVENGELAEHGDDVGGYGEFRIDWTAVASYYAQKERLLDGSKITPGAAIVALADEGFGCNGFSLLLNKLEQIYGNEWHRVPFDGQNTWGDEALRPTKIYTGLFVELTGGISSQPGADVQTLVHNTGGGIRGKFGSKLQGTGCGAELTTLFEPNPAMAEFQRCTELGDEEFYNVFHGGQRGFVVTSEPEKVIALAAARNIRAKVAGEVTNRPEIVIHSKGVSEPGKKIHIPIEQ